MKNFAINYLGVLVINHVPDYVFVIKYLSKLIKRISDTGCKLSFNYEDILACPEGENQYKLQSSGIVTVYE